MLFLIVNVYGVSVQPISNVAAVTYISADYPDDTFTVNTNIVTNDFVSYDLIPDSLIQEPENPVQYATYPDTILIFDLTIKNNGSIDDTYNINIISESYTLSMGFQLNALNYDTMIDTSIFIVSGDSEIITYYVYFDSTLKANTQLELQDKVYSGYYPLYSESIFKNITIINPIPAPVLDTVSLYYNNVYIEWSSVDIDTSQIQNVEIYRLSSDESSYSLLSQTVGYKTSFIDSDIQSGITYYYMVKFRDYSQETSDSSDVKYVYYKKLGVGKVYRIKNDHLKIELTRNIDISDSLWTDKSNYLLWSYIDTPEIKNIIVYSTGTIELITDYQVAGLEYNFTVFDNNNEIIFDTSYIASGNGATKYYPSIEVKAVIPPADHDTVTLTMPPGSIDTVGYLIGNSDTGISEESYTEAVKKVKRNSSLGFVENITAASFNFYDTAYNDVFYKNFLFDDMVTFNKDTEIIIEFDYTPDPFGKVTLQNGEKVKPEQLRVFRLNHKKKQFVLVNDKPNPINTVDKTRRKVRAKVNHLSTYVVLAATQTNNTDYNKIIVYPNPYVEGNPGHAPHGIWFTDVPEDVARIEIYNIAGELIRILRKTGAVTTESNDVIYGTGAHWTLRNEDNRNVASGIYIFKAISEEGNKSGFGKIGVVK